MEGKTTNPLMLDGRLKKYFERANIPTSKSVPLDTVMDNNYCFLPHEQMLDVFHNVGLKNPESEEVILTCQRGITASIVNLALKTLGNEHTTVYDGALEEYAEKTLMKITHE
jgi:3-mercaptopyruvate sulfurtransferase SseA